MAAFLPGGFGEEALHLQVSLVLIITHLIYTQMFLCFFFFFFSPSDFPAPQAHIRRHIVFRAVLAHGAPDTIDLGLSSGNLKWWLPLFENGLTSLSNNTTGWHTIMQCLMPCLGVHWELSPATVCLGVFFFLVIGISKQCYGILNQKQNAKHATGLFTFPPGKKKTRIVWKKKEVEKLILLRFKEGKVNDRDAVLLERASVLHGECHKLLWSAFLSDVLIYI